MEKANKQETNIQLALFKEMGVIQFDRVLSIPNNERIQELVKLENGRARVSAAISASLKSAMDNINLRVGMSEEQIFELAEAIIDQSAEDNLALEDVLLFLKDLITGKAGKIYDRLDMPTFFSLFETYRQKRYEALLEYRDNKHLEYKSLGDPHRSNMQTALDAHLAEYTTKLQTIKDELHEQKEQNKRLRQQ